MSGKELFHDYPMTLVCVDDLEDLSVFKTDLKLLLQALQLRNNGAAMDCLFEKEEYRNVSEDTAKTIAIMTDHLEFLEYMDDCGKEGDVDMCKAVEEIRKKYIDKGIKEGIRALITTCQEFNVSYEDVLEKLKEKYNLSDEESQNYMDLYWIS